MTRTYCTIYWTLYDAMTAGEDCADWEVWRAMRDEHLEHCEMCKELNHEG